MFINLVLLCNCNVCKKLINKNNNETQLES